MKSICIANAADFDRMGRWNDPRPWGAMRTRVGRSLRRLGLKTMPGSWAFADMALFWSRQDCLVIAPLGLDPALITYSDRLMGRNRTQVVPMSTDAGMGAAAAANRKIVRQIVEYLDGDEGELRVWGATEDLYDLVAAVQSAGGPLRLSEAPAKHDFGLVQELDSKTGFRRLVEELQTHSVQIRMPEGYICLSRQELATRVAAFLGAKGDCVVKSNFGSGGFGVLMLQQSPGETAGSIVADMEKRMKGRPSAFRAGPYVVERRIGLPAGDDRAVGATSVLTLIDTEATVHIAGWAREIRDHANHHVGAVLGRGIDDQGLRAELCGQAHAVAQRVGEAGYRGYVGVDFLVDSSELAFAIEANPRRCCSESTTYDIGEALYGPDWDQRKAALLRLPLPIEPGKSRPAAIVLEALESASQELAPDGRVVPLSLSWLRHARPGVGYVVFMPERSDIEAAEKVVISHLRLAGVEPAAAVPCW
jgi:hypothetical protein